MNNPKFIRSKLPTLEQMHRDWEINCLAADAPVIQQAEMRAFMAGVASLFNVVKVEIPELSDDDGIGYLEMLDAQLVEFFS